MKRMTKFIVLILFCAIPAPLISFADTDGAIQLNKDPRGAITLRKAVPLALMHNPELEAFSLERRVREARALQAGLLPNPDLEFMVEDALGSGGFSGFGGSQATLQLSQLVELGGKRAARLRVAESTWIRQWNPTFLRQAPWPRREFESGPGSVRGARVAGANRCGG